MTVRKTSEELADEPVGISYIRPEKVSETAIP
jgi:hypothetical protein